MRSKAPSLCLLSALILFYSLQPAFANLAPDFTLTDIDGYTFSLGDFRGNIVILDFFATWCSPCMEEVPHMKTLQSEFDQALVIIWISVDPTTDTVDKLKTFRSWYKVNWIIARDTIDIFGVYNVTAIPTVYIINTDGSIASRHVGLTEESVFEAELTALIPEYQYLTLLLFLIASTLFAIYAKKRYATIKLS